MIWLPSRVGSISKGTGAGSPRVALGREQRVIQGVFYPLSECSVGKTNFEKLVEGSFHMLTHRGAEGSGWREADLLRWAGWSTHSDRCAPWVGGCGVGDSMNIGWLWDSRFEPPIISHGNEGGAVGRPEGWPRPTASPAVL